MSYNKTLLSNFNFLFKTYYVLELAVDINLEKYNPSFLDNYRIVDTDVDLGVTRHTLISRLGFQISWTLCQTVWALLLVRGQEDPVQGTPWF